MPEIKLNLLSSFANDRLLGVSTSGSLEWVSKSALPISSAVQGALNQKANSLSPTLTGVPIAPTASLGTDTHQIATTKFVMSALLAWGSPSEAGGGDAVRSSGLSQFASTTSAELRTVISDETGTGSLVFANSPTFTGTVVGISKSMVGLANVDNTNDLNKPISSATQTALNAKADLVNGKVPTSQIPSVSIGETFTVAAQSAMLALTAQMGDVAIRTDQSNAKYLLLGTDPTVLANWKDMTLSGGSVSSVNNQTGAVVLGKSDIGLGNVDNTSDATKNAAQVSLTNKTLDAPVFNGSITGSYTFAGTPTFSSSPTVPSPVSDFHAASKKYVDDNILATSGNNEGGVIGSYSDESALPTTGIATGSTAIITGSTRGIWRYTGLKWIPTDSGRRINLLDFCHPAIITDCTAGIQAAIDELDRSGLDESDIGIRGGTIVFPAGYTFKCAGTINMSGHHGIIFEGTNISSDENMTNVNIEFTMAGNGNGFLMPAAHGIEFRNMHIIYSNPEYTGRLIKFGVNANGDAMKNLFRNTAIRGTADAFNAECLVDCNQAIITAFENCSFLYANKGIIGISKITPNTSNYSYAYVAKITNCIWNYVKIAIFNPDALWNITGCTFEPDLDDELIAIDHDFPSDVWTRSMSVEKNYVGDYTRMTNTSKPCFNLKMLGGSFSKNWITLNGNGIGAQFIGCQTVKVEGNHFEQNGWRQETPTHTPGIYNFGTDHVDIDANTIQFLKQGTAEPISHNLTDGDILRLNNNGETVPGGLAFNTNYYVIIATPTKVKLATTLANARAHVEIDIISKGAGAHQLQLIQNQVGLDFRGDIQANFCMNVHNNNAIWGDGVAQTTRYTGSSFNTSQSNNYQSNGGYLENFHPGSQFRGMTRDPDTVNPGVTIGVASDFSNTETYGSAIRMAVDPVTDDIDTGDLVIQARRISNLGNIIFQAGISPINFKIGTQAVTSYKNFNFSTDNAFDIGTSSDSRPRTICAGTSVVTGVLYLQDGTSKLVTVGPADSGGVGFKMLRVAN